MSVVTTKAATAAASIQVARVLVEVAVVTRKAGAAGIGPKTDFSVVAFILDSLQEVLVVLVVQTI
jgi:hypothetical protein